MNTIKEINNQCQHLPVNLQKQVLDFIYFLESRYQPRLPTESNKPLTDEELDQVCGIIKAPFAVSLEQMDVAIKSRRGQL